MWHPIILLYLRPTFFKVEIRKNFAFLEQLHQPPLQRINLGGALRIVHEEFTDVDSGFQAFGDTFNELCDHSEPLVAPGISCPRGGCSYSEAVALYKPAYCSMIRVIGETHGVSKKHRCVWMGLPNHMQQANEADDQFAGRGRGLGDCTAQLRGT